MVENTMPYSVALFELAQETKSEETIMEQLLELSKVWKDNEDFSKALSHPKIARAQKKDWLNELFRDKIDDMLMRFLLVLNEHDVVSEIPSVYLDFVKCYQQAHHIEIIKVNSATSLDEAQISSLKAMLEEKLDKKVELDIKVDPSLIAGLRVQTQDMVFDNTILSKLNTMKEKLKGID